MNEAREFALAMLCAQERAYLANPCANEAAWLARAQANYDAAVKGSK